MHISMEGSAAKPYRRFQTLESSILLRDLLTNPDAFSDHFVRYGSSKFDARASVHRFHPRYQISIVFSMSYGSRIKTANEWIVQENRRAGLGMHSFVIPCRKLTTIFFSISRVSILVMQK